MCRACISATFCRFVCMSVTMHSFSAEVGSRGYHVYRETSWRNIHLHQHVVVLNKVNNIPFDIDPYCCRITIKRVDKIGPVTVNHVPRELPRFLITFKREARLLEQLQAPHQEYHPSPKVG